jgi:hypothetical protein
VEFLDAPIHEAAVIRHGGGDGVSTPLARDLVVHREVERGRLEIQQIVLAGQVPDRVDLGGSDFAAARGFERIQILLDVAAQRPGVLVAELGLEREGMRFDVHGMRRAHVQAQESERRQVARAQHAVEAAAVLRRRRSGE